MKNIYSEYETIIYLHIPRSSEKIRKIFIIIIPYKKKYSLTFYTFHKNSCCRGNSWAFVQLANPAGGPHRMLTGAVSVSRSPWTPESCPWSHTGGHDWRTSLFLTLWVNSESPRIERKKCLSRSFSFSRSSGPYLYQHPLKSKWASPYKSWVPLLNCCLLWRSLSLQAPSHPSQVPPYPIYLRFLPSGREASIL